MGFLKSDNDIICNGVTVKEYYLTRHNPNSIDMPTHNLPDAPLGVTIHNTEWIDVASGTTPAEQYTRATVNGNMKDVRVHFYVDNVCAWQNLPLTLSGWHAADGSGNGNRKTIAIECIMSGAYAGKDQKSEDNCAKLAAYLLHKYKLGIDHLYTHNYWENVRDGVSGSVDYLNTFNNPHANYPYKWCPLYILPHWNSFKSKVQTYLSMLCSGVTAPGSQPAKELYRIRKTWTDAASQIGAYSNLENAKKACKAGYSVYGSHGNVVYSVPATAHASTPTPVTSTTTPKTESKPKADIAGLQKILNIGGAGLVVDGILGPKTLAAAKKYTVENGDTGNVIKWVQQRLNQLGFNCGVADGIAGVRTMNAIYSWQRANKIGIGYLGGSDWNHLLQD